MTLNSKATSLIMDLILLVLKCKIAFVSFPFTNDHLQTINYEYDELLKCHPFFPEGTAGGPS